MALSRDERDNHTLALRYVLVLDWIILRAFLERNIALRGVFLFVQYRRYLRLEEIKLLDTRTL